MSKKHTITPSTLEKTIMAQVMSKKISMKPKWYFVAGSLLMMLGVIGLSIGAIFLANLTFFLLRSHGPMGQWRLQTMLTSFPWWVPILSIIGMISGVLLFRKYDFSYKKNFWLIVSGFIISIVLTAFVLDYSGLNNVWSHQGPMKRFYQQIEGQNNVILRGQRQGRQQYYNNAAIEK